MEGRQDCVSNTLNDGVRSMTGAVSLPAPTARPRPWCLRWHCACMLAGMVTHWAISLLGLLLALRAIWGWFLSQVIGTDVALWFPSTTRSSPLRHSYNPRAHLGDLTHEVVRLKPSLTAEVRGGIAGGIAMIVPAGVYGFLRYVSAVFGMQ